MPLFYFFALPFISAFIALCAVYACYWSLSRQKGDMELHIEGQIDQRLDAIVSRFKEQIPMVGMFLSGAKEDELKGYARVEMLKLLPSVRKNLGMFYDKVKFKTIGTALLVGFVLGVLEAILLWM